MNTKLTRKLLAISLVLLISAAIPLTGCAPEEKPGEEAPPAGALSATRVPNMNLDVCVYIKQERPTTLPAEMINAPFNLDVDSLAIWGVSTEDDFTFGGALTLTSAAQAEQVYAQIKPAANTWTKLSGSTIYLVLVSGSASELLKRAISNNDFKYYDDSQGLTALSKLPGGGTTKLAGVAVAKPSKALINYIARIGKVQDLETVNSMLTMARLQVIAAGLYSPGQIDVAQVAKAMQTAGGISQLDLGIAAMAKSGLPGFIVEPAVKKFLEKAGFIEKSLDGLTLHQGAINTRDGQSFPVLVRIEGNQVFAAISGKESYAQTLITSINK